MGHASRGGQCWNVPWTRGLYGQLWHNHPNNEISLLDSFNRYFPKDDTPERYVWIRQPFTTSSAQHLPSELEDALLDVSSDRTLQTAFASCTLKNSGCQWLWNTQDFQKLQWMYLFLLDLHIYVKRHFPHWHSSRTNTDHSSSELKMIFVWQSPT